MAVSSLALSWPAPKISLSITNLGIFFLLVDNDLNEEHKF
jgi:hypothetical protein